MAAKKRARKSPKRLAKTLGAKADFIRRHPNLSAKEVVEAAAKQGLVIRTPQVYKLRSAAAGKTKKRAPRRSRKAAKGRKPAASTAKSTTATMSKSEFIRTRPPGMTARQVVEAAAAQGMALTEHFVYNIRSTAKKKAGKSKLTAAVAAQASARGTGRAGRAQESTFRRLILALGLDRAKKLVSEVEAKLTALIAGQ
jgi:hypothetical protein